MLILLKLMGRLCAVLPTSIVRFFCVCAGRIVGIAQPGRRRSVIGSIHHAFPDKTAAWCRQVYYESCARIVEMAFFMPASAYFSKSRLESTLTIDAATKSMMEDWFELRKKEPRSAVLLVPHVTLAESATFLPMLLPDETKVSVIFRPLNQPKIDAWLREMRSRFGAQMISRRDGFGGAMSTLRDGDLAAVLFDQNATRKGSMITFFDRVCSATDLPGLFAKRFNSDVIMLIPERVGFWQARLRMIHLPAVQSAEEVAIRAHAHLESYLKESFEHSADWLWLHMRWHHQMRYSKRFKLSPKKNHLLLQNELLGRSETPHGTRLWVRMPNWLGDVVMALPVLRAIQAGRPDFEITLIGKAAFKPLFDRLGVGDRFVPLPPQGRGYFKAFYKKRNEFPDTYLLFTNSFRSDLEAFLTRSQQRFGLLRPNKKRPLLTDPFPLEAEVDETQVHQTHVWEMMARHYGLQAELDFAPIPKAASHLSVKRVGLICGTENAPEKRWPIMHWRALVEQLLAARSDVEVVLYGTPADRAITDQVAEGFTRERVSNVAGETDLADFCDGLKACSVVSCNDTGGMHLANMLGTPVVVMFGPTNPVRTGPIFETPSTLLQPDGCPPTGGAAIEDVSPERALTAILSYLEDASL